MKVILRKDIEKLGKLGDVVTVKDGFARNYLLPRELAFIAKEGAMKKIEIDRKQQLKIGEQVKAAAKELVAKIADLQVTISMKVGEESKLYGSVTAQMIAAQMLQMGYDDIDKRHIIIEEPIKTLGIFDVKIKLMSDVATNIKVWVIAED
jgi:large subunit ribosomal protein L9